MTIRKYKNNIFISSQLYDTDVSAIESLNIQKIICNCFDDEFQSQPSFSHIKSLFKKIKPENIIYYPVKIQDLSLNNVLAIDNLVNQDKKPILLYCKTGTRSALILAMVDIYNKKDINQVINENLKMGYDFSNFIPVFKQLSYDKK